MSVSFRRACAATLFLLALLTLVPPLLAPEGDGLPAFDDTDDDGGPSLAFIRGSVAAMPSVALRGLPAPVVIANVARKADDLPDSAPRRALPSRSPPHS